MRVDIKKNVPAACGGNKSFERTTLRAVRLAVANMSECKYSLYAPSAVAAQFRH